MATAGALAAAVFQTSGGGRPGLKRPGFATAAGHGSAARAASPNTSSSNLSISDPLGSSSSPPPDATDGGHGQDAKPDLRARALEIYKRLQGREPVRTSTEPAQFFLRDCLPIALDEAFAEYRRRFKKDPNSDECGRIFALVQSLLADTDQLLTFRKVQRGSCSIMDTPESSDGSSDGSGSGSGSGSDPFASDGDNIDNGSSSPRVEYTAANIDQMPVDLRLLRKHIRKKIIADKEFRESRRHKRRLRWICHEDADETCPKFVSTFTSLQGLRRYQEDEFVSFSQLNEAVRGHSISSSSSVSIQHKKDGRKRSTKSSSSSSSPTSSSSSSSSTTAVVASVADSDKSRQPPKQSLFAIFDGHGGARAAREARIYLPHAFFDHPDMATSPAVALHHAFLDTDRLINENAKKWGEESGCTAIVAVLRGSRLWVANVGDSQGCLSRAGVAMELSNIHSPNRVDERARIAVSGGSVVFYQGCLRVEGQLAVTRSLGDNRFRHLAIPNPEICEFALLPGDEFIILATDGLWDVMTPQEVVDEVRSRLAAAGKELDRTRHKLPRKLCELSLQKGSQDNVSVLIVWLSFAAKAADDVPAQPLAHSFRLSAS